MFILVDAAIRSLFVGLIVVVGLRIFRIHDVFARKAALKLVLAGALGMPLLIFLAGESKIMPSEASIVLPRHAMTLLEELQAKLLAKSGTPAGESPAPVKSPKAPPSQSHPVFTPEQGGGTASFVQKPGRPANAPASQQAMTHPPVPEGSATSTSGSVRAPRAIPLTGLLLVLYCGIAGILVTRIVLGLAAVVRLWRNALPVSARELPSIASSFHVRASTAVGSPLTIGSGVLLPADYASWDLDKCRVVLAHELSHIRQGDFYLQLLAGLYAAVVWISPLGWWLKRELADLSEAISDRAGIEYAPSRCSYAQILLEFAAAPRPATTGVAMARSGSLTRRIERLLNEQAYRHSFAGSRPRTLCAVVLIPLVLSGATAMVRVQAATHDGVQAASVVQTVHSKPAAGRRMLKEPQQNADNHLHSSQSVLVMAHPESDGMEMEVAAPVQEIALGQPESRLFHVAAVPEAMVHQSDSPDALSFDRTLQVSAAAQLTVITGSGDIQLKRGSDHQIHIHGHVHVSDKGNEEQAREIAANPPVEQSGNAVRIGQEHENWHGISIDYEIEAPAATLLFATSGSGNVVDEGVGRDAKLETGSGDIHAKGLNGSFAVKTGSGEISADGTGEGDVKAETGSGNIDIRNVHGAFRGQTGSGDIKATGTPSAPWMLQTGSGNVEIWAGNAPLTLDASTGSGTFSTDHEMLTRGSLNQHHITGNLNGGGPLVKVQTGSGDISVH